MADPIVVNLAGLFAAHLCTEKCAKTYLHDIRRGVARAELSALAVYVSEEEIVEERGGTTRHECTVSLDYYLGSIERENMDDCWADLREAAKLVSQAVRVGFHSSWPPGPAPAPGTPLLELGLGLEHFELSGKIRYGYFHPIPPTQGTSFLGFRAALAVEHVDLPEPADVTPLGPMFGTLVLPAEGSLPDFNFVEFRPLAAP